MRLSLPKALGGALLVAGTAIGAGMLALPVVSAAGGFIPACFLYLLCYLFSAATGLLLLEVCLWMPNDANMISMATHLFGPLGKMCAWILYLFLFYCLTIAYVAGGGAFLAYLLPGEISYSLGVFLFTTFFGAVVYLGTRFVDRINFILMIGLILTYILFVFQGTSKIEFSFLKQVSWGDAVLALPVIFTSFSYQGIIPSLTTYLERNPKGMRCAILGGTAVPFIAYIIWEFLILGMVPLEGVHSLSAAKGKGGTPIEILRFLFPHTSLPMIGEFFAFFALTTSFLGVTLGLLDFLSDGLQIAKVGWKKIFLCALIYLPPIFISATNPSIFLKALGYAGGIGCVLLLGLFPILMVWVGRYKRDYGMLHQQLKGGKTLLVLLALFVLFELIVELTVELL